ncbi:MAG: sigma-70 family RNA polymerase sigma factor [Deltaproteobacteria bacterium]|nr:sigma-70 family RNA polymerase sigma factor [Deltaproteobacteria bacterium]
MAEAATDERELLSKLRARDGAAFRALVNRYHASFVRVARSFVASDAIAQEVAQEAWLKIIEGLDAFEGRSSLKTWMFTIVSNRAKTRGVREKRSVPWSSIEPDDTTVDPARFDEHGRWSRPPASWGEDTPERAAMRAQSLELLAKEIEGLPEQQRLVVTLRDVHGLDAEEVCNILEVSETNQRVLLHRARSRLRAAIEAACDRS